MAHSLLLQPAVAADNAAMQSEPSKAEPPKRQRRWFQFGLRTLLILVFLLCVGMRWTTAKADRRKAAVEAIRKDGGLVWYDFEVAVKPIDIGVETKGDRPSDGFTVRRSFLRRHA